MKEYAIHGLLTLIGFLFVLGVLETANAGDQTLLWSKSGLNEMEWPSYSNDGGILAVSARDYPLDKWRGTYKLLNSNTGTEIRNIKSTKTYKLLFMPNSNRILYHTDTCFVQSDVDTYSNVLAYEVDGIPNQEYHRYYTLSSSGKYLVGRKEPYFGNDRDYRYDSVFIWDNGTGKITRKYVVSSDPKYPRSRVWVVALDDNNNRLWINMYTRDLEGWFYTTLNSDDTLHYFGKRNIAFCFEANLLSYPQDSTRDGVAFVNATTMEKQYTLPISYGDCMSIGCGPTDASITRDGKYYIVANKDGVGNYWIESWSLKDRTFIDTLTFLPYGRTSIGTFNVCDDSCKHFAIVAHTIANGYRIGGASTGVTCYYDGVPDNVFPNPSTGIVTIVSKTLSASAPSITIRNAITGQVLSNITVVNNANDGVQIDTSSLPAGEYLVELQSTVCTKLFRFVVTK